MSSKDIRITLLAAVAATALGVASLAAADDTEVFFARAAAAENRTPNVLFMFDISGSMATRDGGEFRRITRLKQAMLEVLDNTAGVNIGIGAFNGSARGGAILRPVADPDADACAGDACEGISVRAIVEEREDDAEEYGGGGVELYSANLDFGNDITDSTLVRSTYTLASGADDAVEHAGVLDTAGEDLPLFHIPGTSGATKVGLRYTGVSVPAGARIVDARVVFRVHTQPHGLWHDATITVGSTPSPAAFADTAGRRLSDRPTVDGEILWNRIPRDEIEDTETTSANFAPLLERRVAASDWSDGDAITVFLDPGASGEFGESSRRHYKSFDLDATLAPRLELTYTLEAAGNNKVGLRFASVDVPRGATVRHATLEFTARGANEEATALELAAEAVGDAAAFAATSNDISGRTLTDGRVDWSVPVWDRNADKYRTPDLASLVQEVVDRSEWCGGNAMAFIVSGSGHRIGSSRDNGEWTAPVLRVSYDPSTVDLDKSCLSASVQSRIAAPADDAVESVASAAVSSDGATLSTGDGADEARVALRFGDVRIPAGAAVSQATLHLTSASATTLDSTSPDDAAIGIRGEASGFAAPIDAGTAGDLSSRSLTAAQVTWRGVGGTTAGERLASPDLAEIVQEIVGTSGWSSGNALSLQLRHGGGADQRVFHAFEGGAAATLTVKYRLEGKALEDADPVLRTVRDTLRDEVLDLRFLNGTPLVDAYYEAASYMLGGKVHWGRARGAADVHLREQNFHISTPASWDTSVGSVYTPPGCDEVDPHDVACIGERIDGEPSYVAPVAGACQANQIVLLSDGYPNYNGSKGLIRTLTGETSCAARADGSGDCGVELASWLAGDAGGTREPIVTHTVGFNVDNLLLRDIATAGKGRFTQASSANELAGIFRKIIDEAASIDTSFVAPAATVSQFNRLRNRDDVYFAMFRPSLTSRWSGNLKRYDIGTDPDSGETVFLDALGQPILDETSGGIRDDAKSFWSDTVDGSDVTVGGAANEIPASRALYTYSGAPADATLVPFHEDTAAIDATSLGVDAGERDQLLRWARGVDIGDVDGDGDVSEIRQEIGDPMHSTPFILNYASSEPAGRSLVFVGTNEGFLHAIDTASGAEVLGFIPPELWGNLARFRENATDLDRPYGLDGPVSGWFEDANDNLVIDSGEKAVVVVGMRRGGRNYYALDVSDPSAPALEWVIEGGKGDFAELGQSWSKPIRARVRDNGVAREVLVFAAGYDEAGDAREKRDDPTRQDASGRGLFVVDAATGALLASYLAADDDDLDYSMPSDLAVVDVDFDGFADLVFAGDSGGQIWRFDIATDDTTAIGSAIDGAVLADFGGNARKENRRFHYPPDVALVRDDEGEIFMNVAIGSGWRAHPLDDVVEDRLYALRVSDFYGPPRDEDGEVDYPDPLDENDLYDASAASVRADTGGKSATGWYLAFDDGEKVLGAPVTVNRRLLFTTYVPGAGAADECSVSVGGGRLRALDAVYAEATLDLDGDGALEALVELGSRGIPPSVGAMIGSDGTVTANVGLDTFDPEGGASLRRTYWAEH